LTAHFALFPWFAWSELLAGIAKTSMQRVQNSSQDKDWAVSKCSDTNLVFKTDIFLIAVVINTKRSSGALTFEPATAFSEFVYFTSAFNLSNISAV